MNSNRRRTLIVLAVAALVGVAAGVTIGLIEDDDPDPGAGSAPAAPPPTTEAPADDPPGGSSGNNNETGEPQLPPEEDDPQGAEPGPSGPPPETTDEQAAASAARGYVQALDRRAGPAVCGTFVPGSLDDVDFPVDRPSCPATVKASLGFKRKGFPIWESSEMTDAVSAQVTGDTAKVVATVFTVYSDVREPTIEDDIVYLQRTGDRWQIAQPSLTFHRAIGDADPPPAALSPP